MAYTQGDADFSDDNNNGLYDTGESFSTYAEPFRDDNQDGVWQAGEKAPIDVNNDGSHTSQGGITTFQGTLCSDAAKAAGHCATNMVIWDDLVLTMSGEAVNSGVRIFRRDTGAEVTSVSLAVGNYYLVLQDNNGNIPANGTSVTYSAEGYETEGENGSVVNGSGVINIAGLPSHGAVFQFSVQDADPADNPPSPKIEFAVVRANDTNILKVPFPIVP